MEEKRKHRILVCPLGWGLGHVSRDIPIINLLLKNGNEVIVAADKSQLLIISQRFEGIHTIHFPSFKVQFSKKQNQVMPLIWIAIRLPYHIVKEHIILKRLIKQHKIDLVISDNRYGLWNRSVKTILITHQLKVIFPYPFTVLEPIGSRFIRAFINRYNCCWVPDFEESQGIAGELSHPNKLTSNSRYIGILSRFIETQKFSMPERWELVAVVSGPSPQRELFIKEIENLARIHNLKTLIIKGNPREGSGIIEQNGIWYTGHLNDEVFAHVLRTSKFLICRAGYSSIMDLIALGVSGLIVPTPGQTEQEYLSEHLSKKGLFATCKQSGLRAVDISLATMRGIEYNLEPKMLTMTLIDIINM